MLLMVSVLSNYCSPLTGTWENSKSEIFIVLTSIKNRKNLTKWVRFLSRKLAKLLLSEGLDMNFLLSRTLNS